MKENTVIIGVGGSGCKILSKLNLDVPKVFIDTDKEVEEKYSGLRIGEKVCGDLSACGDISNGEIAAIENKAEILDKVGNFENWIIIAPMGGGTSCGTTKKLVEFACDNNKTIKVITNVPFEWEGNTRKLHAINTLVYIENFCEVVNLKFDKKQHNERISLNAFFNIIDDIYISELMKIFSE